MKKIGIVGGVAWQSTVDYYSELCRRSQQWQVRRNLSDVPTFPEISIESLDLAKAVSYLGSDDDEPSWSEFDEYHRAALKRLEVSGAEVALIWRKEDAPNFQARWNRLYQFQPGARKCGPRIRNGRITAQALLRCGQLQESGDE